MSHVLAYPYSVSPIDSTAQGSGERRDTLQVHVVWYTRQRPCCTLPDSQKPKADDMVEWHHQLHGCEFEQDPGVGDGQESLVCSAWGRKE